ncbi:MAG TPA: hypothetical protein VNG12_03470, partial [Acidimicrobiales bacterium]|nr:hypothetical protein [Acidimicrobiales bacterium]
TISDPDSDVWVIDFPPNMWKPGSERRRSHLVLKIELLEGLNSGKMAWGDVVIDESDFSARMTGRSPFTTRFHGPGVDRR